MFLVQRVIWRHYPDREAYLCRFVVIFNGFFSVLFVLLFGFMMSSWLMEDEKTRNID
ncbi:hypothetical protein Xszus_00054 [Xenorhabdus szentirmaii]|nr:hypothetical protein Xsze_03974 [Xenorhabdus szentirmaii DSM 16338]PHM40395.1 hypothetical protein Xszus_00054 [Xenorhabdus szentirmaii]